MVGTPSQAIGPLARNVTRVRSDVEVPSAAAIVSARQRRDYDFIIGVLRMHASLDPSITRLALRVLRKDNVSGSAEAVYDVLEHGPAKLRVAAARTLGVVCSSAEPSMRIRAVEAIGRWYGATDEWAAKTWFLAALGDIGGSQAVEILSAAARDDHPRVAHSAARALGKLGDPAGIPAFQDYLAASHPVNPYGHLRLFLWSQRLRRAARKRGERTRT